MLTGQITEGISISSPTPRHSFTLYTQGIIIDPVSSELIAYYKPDTPATAETVVAVIPSLHLLLSLNQSINHLKCFWLVQ
jgi:hypothetical protein